MRLVGGLREVTIVVAIVEVVSLIFHVPLIVVPLIIVPLFVISSGVACFIFEIFGFRVFWTHVSSVA